MNVRLLTDSLHTVFTNGNLTRSSLSTRRSVFKAISLPGHADGQPYADHAQSLVDEESQRGRSHGHDT